MEEKKRNIFLHEVNKLEYSSEGAHIQRSFPVNGL